MTTLQQKQLAFLNETITHFNLYNRGLSKNGCTYSAGCAIGRHLTPELCVELDGEDEPGMINEDVFKRLPENLQKLGQAFLVNIQGLHDDTLYWNETGLSEQGKGKVSSIISKFSLV